jgi:dienelactone hydrolase
MTQLHLQAHLDNIYQQTDHQFEFAATHLREAQVWQLKFRKALRDCLKITGRRLPEKFTAQQVSSIDKGTYTEEKHIIVVDGVATPLYLLVPKSEPPYPALIAFHGHGTGVHHILGNYDDPELADMNRAKDENFAQRFAEDGYLVCAIEQQGFGERVTDQQNDPPSANSCRHLAFEYMMHNRTLLGERVWDGMNAISYLLQQLDIIPGYVGCVGFSGGGTTALFLSALDERITHSVIAGYFCALKQSILGVEHCECNYVPDLLTLGEISDIAGLIAPRPLSIISGEFDPIFPIAGVIEQYDLLQDIYQVFDAEQQCGLGIHPHGHRPDYELMAEGAFRG